jgi:hypothetical protein
MHPRAARYYRHRLTSMMAAPRRAAAPAAAPLLTNLSAYWELDEASGQRNDSHTNALHLTDNNTVGSGLGVDGVSTAADFERDNTEYLSRASEAALVTGNIDFSIGLWVRPESSGGNMRLLGAWGGVGQQFVIYIDGSMKPQFYVSSNGSDTVGSGAAAALSAGTWHWILIEHDATANTISIRLNNGSAVSASHSAGVYAGGSRPFQIGTYDSNTSSFDGLIQGAGFWKRVLTADERTWLYNSGAAARTYAEVAAYAG